MTTPPECAVHHGCQLQLHHRQPAATDDLQPDHPVAVEGRKARCPPPKRAWPDSSSRCRSIHR
jgi:hypothetical protein